MYKQCQFFSQAVSKTIQNFRCLYCSKHRAQVGSSESTVRKKRFELLEEFFIGACLISTKRYPSRRNFSKFNELFNKLRVFDSSKRSSVLKRALGNSSTSNKVWRGFSALSKVLHGLTGYVHTYGQKSLKKISFILNMFSVANHTFNHF